ncbi:hypothetical protein DQ384_05625 [Sphaerisporangium album]|uniref:Uncharacterized protein n=1 Tax=Sphaerisporangium album TaxID=509200 RepID=A0A367FQQ2_9ACTN|nr:hypothetical protein [Sphaerisporangium album]RCG32020.1 hypothetical protein DQ384_05625 [Sphaerisporangium album]
MITTVVLIIGAVLAGRRRSQYDGVRPVIWWREQRMYRRRRHIVARLVAAVLGAGLLVGSVVVLFGLAGILAAAALAAALLAGLWYLLRLAARAIAPRILPIERTDLDLPEPTTPLPGICPGPAPFTHNAGCDTNPLNLEV